MTNKLTVWQYDLPSESGEAWGSFILRSDGYFSCVTDYGNHAYRWAHYGGGDFRHFVLGLGSDYVVSKFTNPTYHQTAATRKASERQCDAFCAKMMPRLRAAIRAEMERERENADAAQGKGDWS